VLQFYQYDEDIPLDARVVVEESWITEELEESSYPVQIREKIVFTGGRGDRVPGYLGIPQTGSPPYPCVLQLHGLPGIKQNWWDDESGVYGGLLTRELLSAGIAVLALDAQFHGERRVNNDYESPSVILFQKKLYNKFNTLAIESVIDYRRAIDYLETRTDIDTDRIGVLGYSMGGAMTYDLAVVEPRIKVAVDCVGPAFKPPDWPTDFAPWIPYNFAPAIPDIPFLMLRAKSDEFCSVEDTNELFELIKSPRKEISSTIADICCRQNM
jgi:dienelactone hydrolase